MNKDTIRDALSRHASGIAIATCTENGVPLGMTVSSFSAVSLEPPTVLWCVGRQAPEYAAFCEAQYFGIHLLSSAQMALSNVFATAGADKFKSQHYTVSEHDVPILNDTMVSLECERTENLAVGDHNILVGQIRHCTLNKKESAPLLYFDRAYREPGPALTDCF